jgi:hypothetical protein
LGDLRAQIFKTRPSREDIVRADFRQVHSVRVLATLLVLALIMGVPARAKAEPMREFILSCSYGVLAGSLVGAASLAFSDKPGDNLNRVARGASIGLYAGILLGLYVVYGVPEDDEEAMKSLGALEGGALVPSFVRPQALVRVAKPLTPPRLALLPVMGERGLEGGALSVRVLNF